MDCLDCLIQYELWFNILEKQGDQIETKGSLIIVWPVFDTCITFLGTVNFCELFDTSIWDHISRLLGFDLVRTEDVARVDNAQGLLTGHTELLWEWLPSMLMELIKLETNLGLTVSKFVGKVNLEPKEVGRVVLPSTRTFRNRHLRPSYIKLIPCIAIEGFESNERVSVIDSNNVFKNCA